MSIVNVATSFSVFIAASTASAQISLPEGATGFIAIPSSSPIPKYCRPIEKDASLFVASKFKVLPVFEADGIKDFNGLFEFGFFDLSGLFLFDSKNSGEPEAFGFGTARSGPGGGYPSYLWINNYGEQIDLRDGIYSENFSKGIPLDERYFGDDLPTLVINLSEWTCSVSTYRGGDVAADYSVRLLT